MTANELRENCREYYWQEIQKDEKLKAQYKDIVKKMTAVSREGIDYLILPVEKISAVIHMYLGYSGFEVEFSLGETIISWKK